MPLGTELGLGQGDIMLDGDPAPPKKGTAPNFRPMSIVAMKVAQHPPLFGSHLLWPNGRPSQLLLSSCLSVVHQQIGQEERLLNDLFCVELDVKP